jgi:hypothetical protein
MRRFGGAKRRRKSDVGVCAGRGPNGIRPRQTFKQVDRIAAKKQIKNPGLIRASLPIPPLD